MFSLHIQLLHAQRPPRTRQPPGARAPAFPGAFLLGCSGIGFLTALDANERIARPGLQLESVRPALLLHLQLSHLSRAMAA